MTYVMTLISKKTCITLDRTRVTGPHIKITSI